MDPLFQFYQLNDEGVRKAQNIATHFDDLLNYLVTVCKIDTREFSLVKTKLEEASFFAKKAMSLSVENQKGE